MFILFLFVVCALLGFGFSWNVGYEVEALYRVTELLSYGEHVIATL
tara:strand:- start:247 stop:384 length:138 start_codon:yes stop_codon:yes gene_type:complete